MAIPILRFALAATLAAPAWAAGEPFYTTVLRASGMASGPGTATNPDDEIDSGSLWLANLNTSRVTRITGTGYLSPVFTPAGDAILAIKDDRIVRIPLGESDPQEEGVFQLEDIVKLIGFLPDGRLLVAAGDGDSLRAGLLTLGDGQVEWLTPDPNSARDRAALARIRGWDRVYGRFRLTTERLSEGDREWTDVVLEEAGKAARTISDCQGLLCGQAAMAPAKGLVVFVRSQP
jgi:hypothetical protein